MANEENAAGAAPKEVSHAPLTHETALKRACLWLSALIEACDCDPETTEIKITARLKDGVTVVQMVNLAADMTAFEALGAKTDLMSGAEVVDQ